MKLFIAIRQFFSSGIASTIIIVTAIASRIMQLLFFYNIRSDASYQTIATDNLLQGHGVSLGRVNPLDFSVVVYEPLTQWPPGYSFLLAPFYWLSGSNYILSGLLLDVVFAVAFMYACRSILRLLQTPNYLINLNTIISGFFIYEFYFKASSDDIAVTFLLFALLFCLRLLNNHQRSKLYTALLTACLLWAAFMKYLFVPVVLVLPAFLFIYGIRHNNHRLKKSGLFLGITVLGFLLAYFFYQLNVSGSAGHISSSGRGFFPEQLRSLYPFATSAFFNATFWSGLVPIGGVVMLLMKGISVFAAAIGFIWLLKILFGKDGTRSTSPQRSFLILATSLSLLVIAVLTGLSVLVEKEEPFAGQFWTYVEEPRYYGLVTVLIQLCFFILIQNQKKRNLFYTFLFLIICIAFTTEVARGIAFTANRVRLFGKEEYSWQYEDRFQRYADTIVKGAKLEHPEAQVIVSGSSYYYNHRVSLYSHLPVLYDDASLYKNPNASKPTVVLHILHNTQEVITPDKSNRVRLAGRFNDFYFYLHYVAANR